MTTHIAASTGAWHDQVKQVTDCPVRLERMPESPLGVNHVRILTPDPLPFEVSGPLQLGHDALHRALSDAHCKGNFTQRLLPITRQADQNVGMIGEKIPVRGGCLRHDFTYSACINAVNHES